MIVILKPSLVALYNTWNAFSFIPEQPWRAFSNTNITTPCGITTIINNSIKLGEESVAHR